MFTHLLHGLSANHEVHGCEQLLPATSDQAISGNRETVSRLLSASGCETYLLEGTDEFVRDSSANLGHADKGGEVPDAAHVLELAGKRPVPRHGVRPVGKILVHLELKASGLHCLECDFDLLHVGDSVTELDAEANLAVVWVVVVVGISHEPLVDSKDTAWLENTENLRVDALEGWRVDCCLDGVDCVERVLGKGHLLHGELVTGWTGHNGGAAKYHEVALHIAQLVRQTLLLGVVCGALDLVVVVVQTNNIGTGELDHLSCRAADTTADIQNLHALLHAHDVGEVVLMTGDSLMERLAVGKSTEVEALTPAILVQVGREVVVMSGKSSVLCLPRLYRFVRSMARKRTDVQIYLSDFWRFVLGVFVIPVLEVLIHGRLLGIGSLSAQNGAKATLCLSRLAMQRLVECCIAAVVLGLESVWCH